MTIVKTSSKKILHDIIRELRKRTTLKIVMSKRDFEVAEEAYYEYLQERYGANDYRSLPVVRESIEEPHFILLGKPVMMEL